MAGILLVHGGWHGPWCWDAFAQRLAERGHDARAVLLRGHDQAARRIWYLVRHYVDDLTQAAAEFTEPPVVVGHSLGGLIVQKYLEHHPAPAAVLMASIPPGGTIGPSSRLVPRHPLRFAKAIATLRLRVLVDSAAMVRELFFTPDTPQEIVDSCLARLQDESFPAYLETMFFSLPRPDRVRTPMLVLGAQHDGALPLSYVHRAASRYGTKAEIYPIGHDMMLDVGWEAVADRVDAWAAAHQTRAS